MSKEENHMKTLCGECGTELMHTRENDNVIIEPCPKCMEQAGAGITGAEEAAEAQRTQEERREDIRRINRRTN